MVKDAMIDHLSWMQFSLSSEPRHMRQERFSRSMMFIAASLSLSLSLFKLRLCNEDGNDKEEDLLNPLPVGNFKFSLEQATWFEHNTPALAVDMALIFMLA
uniref:Uncharacterized protein n=1 Tax=Salix viminalis TaxID=40686 RepID=A0A6N2L4M9_SALVM